MGKKQFRVAMIGHKRMPSREGGIETVVTELAPSVAKRGISVTVYNRGGKHVSGKEHGTFSGKEYKGVKVKKVLTIDIKGLAAFTSSFFAPLRATKMRYDCIHYHAEGPSAMLWLPHFLGIRTVVTIHGLDWLAPKWKGFAKKYIMFGEKISAKYADEIIVLNKGNAQYFKEKYNRDTNLIPNGIHKPLPRPAKNITENWGLVKDSYILYLSRIIEGKGIEYLIEAYKGLKTDKKLVIAGGVSDSNEFYEALRQMTKGNENIIFTGFVKGETLNELYENAYLYVLPSDHEGMPLTLLEAMAAGACAVTSDISECTDVTEGHGFSFKKGNAKDLNALLQKLINEPELVYNTKSGSAEFILNKYNWDDVTDKTIKLYKNT